MGRTRTDGTRDGPGGAHGRGSRRPAATGAMIRVGFNARALAKPGVEGVIRYARELLVALAEREAAREEPAFEYLLFGVDGLPDPLSGYDCVRCAGEPAWTHSGLAAHAWEQLALPVALRGRGLDVFHTPAGEPPILSGVRAVTTVHDVSPVTNPEWFSRRYVALHAALLPLTVRRSDRLITVSAFSREEIIDVYPAARGKTVAVHNGTWPPEPPGTPVSGLEPGGFLLFVGAANPRKNVEGLLTAYARYRERAEDPVPLAVAGAGRSRLDGAGATTPEGVRALGFVPDDELRWLYHNAVAFAYPSLYEGFGLPILEAMGAGTPVVTADRGAMAEVAGDAAALVDPEDPDGVAEGIRRVVHDEAYRERLIERGRARAAEFTWDRAAAGTEAVYREVVGR